MNEPPCPECGSADAYWHGDLLRIYCCYDCWIKIRNNQKAPA